MPKACAAKTDTIPTYSAVPSILIVAPRGKTVEAIIGRIPRFSSATDIDTGNVAELEEVEKATNIASRAPRKNIIGDNFNVSFMMMRP